jgi:hypothetical protein
MSDPNTLRILELDGGGERGYLSLKFLQLFLNQWLGPGITNIAPYFDVICGTSIGGVLALAMASGQNPYSLDSFFTVKGKQLFSTNGVDSNRATTLNKIFALTVSGVPFYSTQGTSDTYGSNLLESELQAMFGANTMQSLQTKVVIPTYKVDLRVDNTLSRGVYTLCSNVNTPGFVGQNELISNVALVTSAAPFYLPSKLITSINPHDPTYLNGRYIDGGVYANNPALFGRNLAQILKPNANRCCVVSIGTGLGEMGFDDPAPSGLRLAASDPLVSVTNLFGLFDVASTGGQESVAQSLFLESQYTLSNSYYYRFQPVLDASLDTELDNTDDDILAYYASTANNYYNDDLENIITFIGHLTA